MAWLNATPKPAEGTRRAKAGLGAKISRLDQMRRDGLAPKLPPNPAPIIINRLIELGLTEPAGMGMVPISWQTLSAWQKLTGVQLAPWEARMLRTLSSEYLAESRRAESENCPAPWRTEVTEREREVDLARLRAVLG